MDGTAGFVVIIKHVIITYQLTCIFDVHCALQVDF